MLASHTLMAASTYDATCRPMVMTATPKPRHHRPREGVELMEYYYLNHAPVAMFSTYRQVHHTTVLD